MNWQNILTYCQTPSQFFKIFQIFQNLACCIYLLLEEKVPIFAWKFCFFGLRLLKHLQKENFAWVIPDLTQVFFRFSGPARPV